MVFLLKRLSYRHGTEKVGPICRTDLCFSQGSPSSGDQSLAAGPHSERDQRRLRGIQATVSSSGCTQRPSSVTPRRVRVRNDGQSTTREATRTCAPTQRASVVLFFVSGSLRRLCPHSASGSLRLLQDVCRQTVVCRLWRDEEGFVSTATPLDDRSCRVRTVKGLRAEVKTRRSAMETTGCLQYHASRNEFERFRAFCLALFGSFSRFEFEFCRRGNYFQITIRVFLCVRGSFTHYVTLHVHVLWPVFAHVLMCRNRCRHSRQPDKQQTQHRYQWIY